MPDEQRKREIAEYLERNPGMSTERYGTDRYNVNRRLGEDPMAAVESQRQQAGASGEFVPLGQIREIYLHRRKIVLNDQGPLLGVQQGKLVVATPLFKLPPQPELRGNAWFKADKSIEAFASGLYGGRYVLEPLTQILFLSTMECGSHLTFANFLRGPNGEYSVMLWDQAHAKLEIYTPPQIPAPGWLFA